MHQDGRRVAGVLRPVFLSSSGACHGQRASGSKGQRGNLRNKFPHDFLPSLIGLANPRPPQESCQ